MIFANIWRGEPFDAITLLAGLQTVSPSLSETATIDGDIYRWGSLMAGALVGLLPLMILYGFFVEHSVSAVTGAVKE